MLGFRAPDIRTQETGEQASANTPFSSKLLEKLAKWGLEIHPKAKLIGAWAPKCPSLCFQMLQDRPWVPQDAEVEALGLPNDKFAYQKNDICSQECQESQV